MSYLRHSSKGPKYVILCFLEVFSEMRILLFQVTVAHHYGFLIGDDEGSCGSFIFTDP